MFCVPCFICMGPLIDYSYVTLLTPPHSSSLLTMAKGKPNKHSAVKLPHLGKSKRTSNVCKKTDVVAHRTPKTRPAMCAKTLVGRASTRPAAATSRPRTRTAAATADDAKKSSDSSRKPKVMGSDVIRMGVLANQEEAQLEAKNKKTTATEMAVDEAQTKHDGQMSFTKKLVDSTRE